MNDLQVWLATPVTRVEMIARISFVAGASIAVNAVSLAYMARQANKILDKQATRVTAMKEISLFLLERADGQTHDELNEKLDFWRVVLEMPTSSEGEQG